MLTLRSARTPVLLASLCAIALIACGSEAPASSASSDRSAAAEGAAADPAVEPGYTVSVELPPRATKGQEALARVQVRPKEPWHMNLEYPVKLRLEAPDDVELVAPLQRKADAERYDDQALEFSVLFTPQAHGPRKIQGQLDFAVCGGAACGQVTESIELAFEVGCRVEDTGLC